MDLEDIVVRRGWTATWADLRRHHSRTEIESALREGRIERVGRGSYSLRGVVGEAREAATRVNGVVSHLSAAIHWGIAVRTPPHQPTVTVPRGRKLSKARRKGVQVFWADLPVADVRTGVTTPLRTVLDCAARLPYAEALVVADSALFRKKVTREELSHRAAQAPKHVRDRVRTVVDDADGRAQSAFESLVRAHARDVPGINLVPQVAVAGYHPDLYDARLGLAVECDSFEFHSKRDDLVSDCERYNHFALTGDTLVRFAWEHAMNRPGYVRHVLEEAAQVRQNLLARLDSRGG